jgi:hypothetical protein
MRSFHPSPKPVLTFTKISSKQNSNLFPLNSESHSHVCFCVPRPHTDNIYQKYFRIPVFLRTEKKVNDRAVDAAERLSLPCSASKSFCLSPREWAAQRIQSKQAQRE